MEKKGNAGINGCVPDDAAARAGGGEAEPFPSLTVRGAGPSPRQGPLCDIMARWERPGNFFLCVPKATKASLFDKGIGLRLIPALGGVLLLRKHFPQSALAIMSGV